MKEPSCLERMLKLANIVAPASTYFCQISNRLLPIRCLDNRDRITVLQHCLGYYIFYLSDMTEHVLLHEKYFNSIMSKYTDSKDNPFIDVFGFFACLSCFISQANNGVFSYNAALLAFKTYAIGQTVVGV